MGKVNKRRICVICLRVTTRFSFPFSFKLPFTICCKQAVNVFHICKKIADKWREINGKSPLRNEVLFVWLIDWNEKSFPENLVLIVDRR